MTKKRRQQIKLIGDVLFNLLTIGFCLVGLLALAQRELTPELRAKPFDNTLEPIIGHTAMMIFVIVVCVLILLSAVFFLYRAVRRLINPALLEEDEARKQQASFTDFYK